MIDGLYFGSAATQLEATWAISKQIMGIAYARVALRVRGNNFDQKFIFARSKI